MNIVDDRNTTPDARRGGYFRGFDGSNGASAQGGRQLSLSHNLDITADENHCGPQHIIDRHSQLGSGPNNLSHKFIVMRKGTKAYDGALWYRGPGQKRPGSHHITIINSLIVPPHYLF